MSITTLLHNPDAQGQPSLNNPDILTSVNNFLWVQCLGNKWLNHAAPFLLLNAWLKSPVSLWIFITPLRISCESIKIKMLLVSPDNYESQPPHLPLNVIKNIPLVVLTGVFWRRGDTGRCGVEIIDVWLVRHRGLLSLILMLSGACRSYWLGKLAMDGRRR